MVTHLELDIVEYEVKWAVGSITTNKARKGDRILAELFKILKDDAFKVLHSMCQKTWKIHQWPNRTGKCQFSVQSQRIVITMNVQTTV